MARGELRGSNALRDLIVLVAISILLYVLAALFGGFNALEKWERENGLSGVHVVEIVVILVILGVATTIFFIRRYKELHGEVLELKESERILRETRSQAILQQKELEKMFRQVETVKNEWERMLDCTGGMVVLVDSDGRVNRCNLAFKAFVRKTYTEIRGKDLSSLLKEQGVDAKNLAGRTLTAYSAVKGKRLELKSYPYKDFMTGDIAGAVIIIHEEEADGRAAEAFRGDKVDTVISPCPDSSCPGSVKE